MSTIIPTTTCLIKHVFILFITLWYLRFPSAGPVCWMRVYDIEEPDEQPALDDNCQ
jgi:hypothetical protein